MSFHLLIRSGYGTETGPTCEIHLVMCTDNVVQVCQIILDSIYTQTGQHETRGLCPSLVLSDREDWNTSKCIPHMQLLQNPQCSHRATSEHNDDIRPVLHFREEQETLEMFHHGR